MEENKKRNPKFTDYLSVLLKWKKFIIINMLIIIIGATIYSFSIPKTFKATAMVMVAHQESMGIGGISSLLGGNSALSLGSKLFGLSSTSEDLIFGLLYSRTALSSAIYKFNLIDYYEIDANNIDKAIKQFRSDLIFDMNENGLIEINVINREPERSAEIANYFVHLVDSLNIKLSIEQARNNRLFLEKRYYANIEDLKKAEDSLYQFQKKYGVIAIPEQLELAVKAAAELEAQLMEKRLQKELLKENYEVNSPQLNAIQKQIDFLVNKIEELKSSPTIKSESNFLFPFDKAPDITLEYYRAYREIEIQSKIMEVLLPMYEQAKVEEQKSIPTLLVIDKAVPPMVKYRPKKAFIILGISFIFFFVFVLIVFRGEKLTGKHTEANQFEINESKIYKKIRKIYKI